MPPASGAANSRVVHEPEPGGSGWSRACSRPMTAPPRPVLHLMVSTRPGGAPRQVALLAGGTSAEELIEGIVIGVSAATDPTLGLMVGVAIIIDNVSEALSIGELILDHGEEGAKRRIFEWTGLIGAALFLSAMAGWFFLRGLPGEWLGSLLAAGAGGMFYLTVTNLVPEAEKHHFNQSAAIATAAGFLTIFTLSELV